MEEIARFSDPFDCYGLQAWKNPGRSRLLRRLKKLKPRPSIPPRRGYHLLRELLGEGMEGLLDLRLRLREEGALRHLPRGLGREVHPDPGSAGRLDNEYHVPGSDGRCVGPRDPGRAGAPPIPSAPVNLVTDRFDLEGEEKCR